MNENVQLSTVKRYIRYVQEDRSDSHLLEHADNLWSSAMLSVMSEPCWYIFRGGFMTNEEQFTEK